MSDWLDYRLLVATSTQRMNRANDIHQHHCCCCCCYHFHHRHHHYHRQALDSYNMNVTHVKMCWNSVYNENIYRNITNVMWFQVGSTLLASSTKQINFASFRVFWCQSSNDTIYKSSTNTNFNKSSCTPKQFLKNSHTETHTNATTTIQFVKTILNLLLEKYIECDWYERNSIEINEQMCSSTD